jgi:hypothetical protein
MSEALHFLLSRAAQLEQKLLLRFKVSPRLAPRLFVNRRLLPSLIGRVVGRTPHADIEPQFIDGPRPVAGA